MSGSYGKTLAWQQLGRLLGLFLIVVSSGGMPGSGMAAMDDDRSTESARETGAPVAAKKTIEVAFVTNQIAN
jgi:hypothetical protein